MKAVLTASGSSIELNLLLISFLFVDIAMPLFGKPYFPVLGSEKLLSYLTFSIQCWGGKKDYKMIIH